jgi:hypothetical protein
MPQGRPHFQLCPFEMPGALEGSAVVLLEAVRLQVEAYLWLYVRQPTNLTHLTIKLILNFFN